MDAWALRPPASYSEAMARARVAFEAASHAEADDRVREGLRALDFRIAGHRLLAAEARALLAEIGQVVGDAPAALCAAKRAASGLLHHRGDPLLAARMLTMVAIALWDRGAPARALPYFAKADAVLGESGARVPVGERINKRSNLALCHFALWRAEESIAGYRSALELAQAHGLREEARSIRRRLSNVHQENGSYELARHLLDAAKPPTDAQAVEHVGWLNASAMLEERRGRLAAAEDQFEQAVAMFARLGSERHRMAAVLSNTALLKLELGRFDEAERLARRLARLGREASGSAPAPLSTRLGALRLQAAIVEEDGRECRAEALWHEAQRLVETEAEGNAGLRSDMIEQRFRLLWQCGRRAEAVEVLSAVVGAVEAGTDDRILATDRIGPAIRLAQAFLDLGRNACAMPLLRAAFRAEVRRSDIEAQWQLLAALADLAAALERPEAAILLGKMAARTIAAAVPPAGIDAARRIPYLERRLRPLSRLTERLVSVGRIVEASAVVAQMKRERLVDFVYRGASPAGAQLAVPMRDGEAGQEEKYGRFCARLATLKAKAEDACLAAAERRHAVELLGESDAGAMLEALLAFNTRIPGVQRPPVRQPHDVVPVPGQGVARFVETKAGVSVHLTAAGDTLQYETRLSRAAIAERIMRLRAAIAERSGAEAGLAADLYDILLRPAAGILNRLERLDLVTAGVLDHLPFACLRDGYGCLIERLALQVRTAALRGTRPSTCRGARAVVAFGATRETAGLPALRHVERELAGLGAAMPEARIFLDEEFTRERFLQELARRPTHVLLACHFHLEPAASHRSYIVLGDGRELRLSELAATGIDFGSVELMILSGCDTATVEVADQGMQSLAGLVLERGAAAVIGSIWPVDDAQTARLMQAMFGELFGSDADIDPAEALRRAQRAIAGAGSAWPAQRRGGIGVAPAPPAQALSPLSWAGFSVYRPAADGFQYESKTGPYATAESGVNWGKEKV